MEQSISKYATSFGLALAIASVVNAVLVIAKEKLPAVQSGLQRMSGHHWISHCIIVLALFGASGWALAQLNGGNGVRMEINRLMGLVVSSVLFSGLLIVGFYLING